MLPHARDQDYEKRCQVLEEFKVVSGPDRAKGKPLEVLKPDVLNELSFALFAGWLFSGIWDREKRKVRVSFAPMRPADTLVVVSQNRTELVPPGRGGSVDLIDEEYFTCPLDTAGEAGLTKEQQVLCPVLNRLRYNLGHPRSPTPGSVLIPQSSKDCCASRKEALWSYVEKTLVAAPTVYWPLVGGAAFPVKLPAGLLTKYATGAEAQFNDLAKLFEETLLLVAMAAAQCDVGLPHCEFSAPFRSHEIDFVLYDSAGKKEQKKEPAGGWRDFVSPQSICGFEITVGHHREPTEEDIEGGKAPEAAQPGRSGQDHPKNKLMNFLALRASGFRRVDFHYLSVTKPSEGLSEPTRISLQAVPGFNYWCLSDKFPELEQRVLSHFETPVDVAAVRTWHSALVDRVREAGSSFGLACGRNGPVAPASATAS